MDEVVELDWAMEFSKEFGTGLGGTFPLLGQPPWVHNLCQPYEGGV